MSGLVQLNKVSSSCLIIQFPQHVAFYMRVALWAGPGAGVAH